MKPMYEARPGQPPVSGIRSWTGAQVYVLALLVLVNLSNYLDRAIVAILQQPLKEDLGLQDWQLGVISGPAFAIFYSLAGLPVARLAERANRVAILSVALSFWSMMTALCGAAFGFLHLVVARIGVGAAEGACTPVTHSLISDTFAPRQRGMALSILTTSIPIAQLIAPIVGGVVAMTWGWRVAFIVVGLPGIVLALALWLTIRDPRQTDPRLASRQMPGRFVEDLKTLLANRAYLWLVIASTFLGQAIMSTNMFTAAYFLRQYGLTLAEAGAITAAGMGVAGLLGTFSGGWLADRFSGEYGRSYPAICGIGAGCAAVLYFVTFTRDSWMMAVPFLLLANFSTDLKNGPNMAAAQNLAPAHLRATAAAVVMLGAVAIGGGIGPLVLGLISDLVASWSFPQELGAFHSLCPGGQAAAGAPVPVSSACTAASAAGLRGGLMWPCFTLVLAALAFFRSARTIRVKLAA